jgi:hypothetical protein
VVTLVRGSASRTRGQTLRNAGMYLDLNHLGRINRTLGFPFGITS